jgi:hypothetical protein
MGIRAAAEFHSCEWRCGWVDLDFIVCYPAMRHKTGFFVSYAMPAPPQCARDGAARYSQGKDVQLWKVIAMQDSVEPLRNAILI